MLKRSLDDERLEGVHSFFTEMAMIGYPQRLYFVGLHDDERHVDKAEAHYHIILSLRPVRLVQSGG